MSTFTPASALAGGALIGLAAVLLMRLNGRIAGISGILGGALNGAAGDRAWRVAFIAGLVLGGTLVFAVTGSPPVTREGFPIWLLVAGGLLVGFGTRLGSGCTSGHGICGVSRLSPRSLAATATFLFLGGLTATVMALLRGAGS